MKIVICLRDLSTSPCRNIVEADREYDFERSDPAADVSDYETEQGAFEDFVQQAREVLPIEDQNMDVYIGWWGDQGTFAIPKTFIQLIAETQWPITFNIND